MPPPGWTPPNTDFVPKKIGMNLGIEYLIRSGLIKKFMTLPCSIFVKAKNNCKVAITINEANDKDVMCCVRNWFISNCEKHQPIPTMKEYMVPMDELHLHPAVILRGFTPIYFNCNSLEWKRNRGNNGHPMPDYIYEDYFKRMFSPPLHYLKKENFLWKGFTDTYIPSIDHMVENHWSEYSRNRRINYSYQQKLVEANFKTTWQIWLKWRKFMLFNTVPGELVFMGDYVA